MTGLTRDNPHLSRLKNAENLAADPFAVSCKTASERIADLVRESLAPNTRTAYLSDLAHFENWGGRIPAEPETIAAYLATHADALSVATLNRRLAGLAKVHRSHGLANPTSSELVKSVLRGLKRVKGMAQRQAKPLLKEDLILALDVTGEGLRDLRDRALLLIGFAGGFRRSELVSLMCHDVEPVRQGIIITLRHSKTDQHGAGRKIGVPYARGRWCPVAALGEWLTASGTTEGALFRKIDRHHRVGANPLSGEAVGLIVRERLLAAGIDPKDYSGHSLRAGLATSAAQAGVSAWKIRQQTGHASDAMLARYIRDGDIFIENAAGALL
jgi:site-specific recombinase XerD